jgi:hypothetical protein
LSGIKVTGGVFCFMFLLVRHLLDGKAFFSSDDAEVMSIIAILLQLLLIIFKVV